MSKSAAAKMGRPPSDESAVTRRRIVDAARVEIVDRGYAGATFDLIGTRAGLTRGSVHYHFPNKQALFLVVVEQAEADVLAAVSALAETPGDTLLAELSACVLAITTIDDDHSTAALVVSLISNSRRPTHRRHRAVLDRIIDAMNGHVAALLARAIERGEMPADVDAGAWTSACTAMVWGMCAYCGLFGDVLFDDAADHHLVADRLGRLLTGPAVAGRAS